MGCFKTNGFFSKLPISVDDDIVLIFCADLTRVSHNDTLLLHSMYEPMTAPIYCKYNDYGGIDESSVVKNDNVKFIESYFGMTCEEICNMLYEICNCNIDELNKMRDGSKYVGLYHKLFDNFPIEKWRNKIGMTYIMEHRDIYEKIAEIGAGRIYKEFTGFFGDDTNTVELACDETFEVIEKFPELDSCFNLLTFNDTFDMLGMESGLDLSEVRQFLRSKRESKRGYAKFTSTSGLVDYIKLCFTPYDEIFGISEWLKYRDDFVNFFRFTRVMRSLNRVFEPCTYAGQAIHKDVLNGVSDVISLKTKEICKNEENEEVNTY